MKMPLYDEDFMQLALEQARLGANANEIPVGAVLAHHGIVIAKSHNLSIQCNDPTAHAEILVLRAAAQHFNNYRLEDCELFVTLEPCAMCAGAILHARLKRVVFGAFDSKTGAAGSVLNVFDSTKLNHHTQVTTGVNALECSHVLQTFFQRKRQLQKAQASPLREDALRTSEARFCNLPDYPWQATFVNSLPALSGLRLHYLDIAQASNSATVVLCLHGAEDWSYVFRHAIVRLQQDGVRIIAPDYIGFGKSDKPKRESVHSLEFHVSYLMQLLVHLNLHNIQLLTQGWGRELARALLSRAPERFNLQVAVAEMPDDNNCLSEQERIAMDEAPFPDRGYKAALRALAQKV